MIYYFTGQPGSGKTTIGKKLYNYIKGKEFNVIQIDGDEIRHLFKNYDYSKEGRYNNIRRVHDIARFMEHQGYHIVIMLVSPYKELRDELKRLEQVTEIYVHTTDIRGKEQFFVDDYEPPTEKYIDLDTTKVTINESFHFLLGEIKNKSK